MVGMLITKTIGGLAMAMELMTFGYHKTVKLCWYSLALVEYGVNNWNMEVQRVRFDGINPRH